MLLIFTVVTCALLFSVKGGQHGFLRNKVTNPVIHRLLDGKILSTALFGLVCLFYYPWPWAIGGAGGWLAGVAPSIGEDIAEQRNGNWRGTLQRGTFLGACLALGLWNPSFIIAGALMGPFLWVSDRVSKDWWLYELLQGAAIGIALVASQ